ncbi:MAG: ChbG/HpnK family deacetylase [Bacteroidetes bacterium]|nr:ChbG/HpnK family deacetylase [Bacteroidota bacterium]
MKKYLLSLFIICTTLWIQAQVVNHPRLIIRGDDMGSTQSSNRACVECYKNGIETSIEVMTVAPWFPEAAKLLKENPGIDVGLHLAITSEWDNIKWRPLTHCPSLTDKNGYFLPRLKPTATYPGLSVVEHKWELKEIEKEFRAQIEMALKNIPQLSHLSGHMGATDFDPKVEAMVDKLAREYNLAHICGQSEAKYGLIPVGYDGPSKTSADKETSFTKMLDKLEAGKAYIFLDHPAYDDAEMKAVHHIGYEGVAADRQGVTELFTSEKVKTAIHAKNIELVSYNDITKALKRSTPESVQFDPSSVQNYLKAISDSNQDIHSIMILRHGNVIFEKWFGDNSARKPHLMYSVSKCFTATAIGFAVTEKRLKLTDKVIYYFPELLPDTISPNLANLEIRDLLTMSAGFANDPSPGIRAQQGNWEQMFLSAPIPYKPGTHFLYCSINTYMLSAIIQRVTGEKLIDYLYPRLFRPLGITGVKWEESPTGINTGGWGLYIKTEDMAKMGQFFIQQGKWNGKQSMPSSWIKEATTAKINQSPQWSSPGTPVSESDWLQGYCYQMWRCRFNAYRADGANGQFIIVVPDKDAVIAVTANVGNMQAEINLIWQYILPAFH